jgi:amino acid adenylation domain-containing protein
MPDERVHGFELSPQQRRLWTVMPDAAACAPTTLVVARVAAVLSPDRLRAAALRVVARHEILRTTLSRLPDVALPVQTIGRAVLGWEAVTIHDVPASRATRAARRWLERWRQMTIDPMAGPTCSMACLAAPGVTFIGFTAPSLCTDRDGAEGAILEMLAEYGGETPAGPSIQYGDAAAMLVEFEKDARQRETYWSTRSPLPSAPSRLPLGFEARPGPRFERRSVPIRFDGETARGLIAAAGGTAPRPFLLACWAAVIARLTGRSAVAIGVGCDGRTHERLQRLPGAFWRSLPLAVAVDHDRPIATAADHIATSLADLDDAQDDYVWEDRDDPEILDWCFDYHETPGDTSPRVTFIESAHGLERFKVQLDVLRLAAHHFSVTIHYDGACVDPAAAARLARACRVLIRDAIRRPTAPMSALQLLDDRERRAVLLRANATDVELRDAEVVHRMVEAQVARTPEAVAITSHGQALSYEAMNGVANRLARVLVGRGIGSGALVGLHIETGTDAVIAMLAVLKAGAAYVPIDPGHPTERVQWMIRHARLACVLDTAAMEELKTVAAVESSDNLPAACSVLDVAYVLYTSGSTGVPKGVAIPHAALANHMRWIVDALRIHSQDVVLQKTSPSFDASVWEFFAPLLVGARLAIVPSTLQQDATALCAAIAADEVTVVQLVPSVLWTVLDSGPIERCRSLRMVCCGGEAFDGELQRRLLARLPVETVNLYGPTETTIDATWWCSPKPIAGDAVPIGSPIWNMRAYVLDDAGEAVPIGVAGELYLGGAGLARGYVHQPAETACRFVPDPFGSRGGARLYRTGDRVRWRASGTLEFLGRLDQQAKIRGVRIEPGEIEVALRAASSVREAVVVVRSASGRDPQLVAYVSAHAGGERIDTDRLREHLGRTLPAYMVPSRVVVVERWPLTRNGKVDRAALPAPRETAAEAAPQTAMEELIAGIWAAVLKQDVGGRDAHFFELGGHSLVATQVVAQVRQVLGVEVPLRALFEAPTVAEFAAAVETARAAERPSAPPLTRRPTGGPAPLSFAQQRLWFLATLAPESTAYHMPYKVALRGGVDGRALQTAVDGLVARHETLRTTFLTVDGTPVQVVQPTGRVRVAVVDVRGLRGARRVTRAVAAAEARRPFALATGPLLRVTRVQEGAREVLLVTLHHIVSDGWSLGIVVREFGALYAAAREGTTAALPALPVQYADYAVWQQAWLQDAELDGALASWRTELAGVVPAELPPDRPHDAPTTDRAADIPFVLDDALWRAIEQAASGARVTPFMVLLAAYEIVIARHTRQRDFAVSTLIANRTRHETDGVLGFFVNALLLRSDLPPGGSFADLLARVRTRLLDAYDRQHVPFEKVVEAITPDRAGGPAPYTRVMIQHQYFAGEALRLDGATVTELPGMYLPAKFDVSLNIVQRRGGAFGTLSYSVDLYHEDTMAAFLRHWQTILAHLVAAPHAAFADVEMLDADERRRVVQMSHGASTPLDPAHLPARFAAQVAATPDAVAVVSEHGSITFAALDRRANAVAARLLEAGVGVDSFVGVHIPRSLDMVIAILATMKAGAAFVPLETTYPLDRLNAALHDARPTRLLTVARLADALDWPAERTVCVDDRSIAEDAAGAADPPAPAVPGSNVVYVIFTSGSTGRPKGVMVTYDGLRNRLDWMQNQYALQRGEPVLHKTAIGFDISVWEIMWPLCYGGRLVLAEPGRHGDPLYLQQLMVRERIAVAHFVPSMLAVFLEADGASACHDLRLMVCSGEPLSAETARRFCSQSAAHLENLYGPTEASIDVTWWSCPAAPPATIPIGRPISNVEAYVLSDEFVLAPPGVAGELCLGGVALARGYVNAPAHTAERFVPDPIHPRPGGRLYRTGDVARWLRDGTIEYLGRTDDQVKIRGNRVELLEVARVLEEHEGVRQAVVCLDRAASGDRLVAYIVREPRGGADGPDEWRDHVRRRLPAYMMPAVFLELARLPVTINGKLDRRALPPVGDADRGGVEYVAPRDVVEQELASIWRELLRVSRIGIHDNFFTLGGHSLLAARAAVRISTRFGVRLPAAAIFEAPTIADLTPRISEAILAALSDAERSSVLAEIQALSPEAVAALLATESARES